MAMVKCGKPVTVGRVETSNGDWENYYCGKEKNHAGKCGEWEW